MKRLACLAVLCSTAFAASPALATTPSTSAIETVAEPKRDARLQRMVLLSVDRRYVVLVCDTGQVHRSTHPKAQEACDALEAVGGTPSRLRPDGTVTCTMESDPVTATATGVWDRRLALYLRSFGNRCALRAATGPVYDF
ncbi:SSI family serine proteinase inhibitor [Nonomuraea africana]|uniref:SSI family serine proteinase inhibitor n=1 Tax=Nonomuraea africana TaxID=46171 RepID=UPI00340E8DD4